MLRKLQWLLRSPEDVGEPVDTVLPRGLQLMKQTVDTAGHTIRLVVPRSVDAVMDMYIETGKPKGEKWVLLVHKAISGDFASHTRPFVVGVAGQFDRDPYWCRVWPSALALAQLILQNPKLVAGKSVCDIGSGLGLGGIAAALAGKSVTHPCMYSPKTGRAHNTHI